MAAGIEEMLMGFNRMPAHLKVGLSGCPRCCGASYVRDIGLVGTGRGRDFLPFILWLQGLKVFELFIVIKGDGLVRPNLFYLFPPKLIKLYGL